MSRTVTITLTDEVYRNLQQQVGEGNISQFIEALLRPLALTESELETGYRAMAADTEREREASEWIELAPDDALE
jgi:predicted CopG family antitoxin